MRPSRLASLGLALASVLVVLLLGELGFRLLEPAPRDAAPPSLHRPCGSCGYVYELDPEQPGISEQGLRDDPVAIPKPAGVFRILLLGDSVAFGGAVPRAELFAVLLENALDRPGSPVEVVNAAVSGYGTYNQLHYFLERGLGFEPDLVLLAFCMNDVVDPLPHWRLPPGSEEIPADAIPNPERHAEEVRPRHAYRRGVQRWAARSALFRRFSRTLLPELERSFPWENIYFGHFPQPPDEGFDTRLTLEDDLGIEVLTDPDSPEWRWLGRQLDALARAVAEAGAGLAVLVFPLSYQMDASYPHLPQLQWRRACEARDLPCLDLLPVLRERSAGRELRSHPEWTDDVWIDLWHLTPKGHRITAAELERFLRREALVPSR